MIPDKIPGYSPEKKFVMLLPEDFSLSASSVKEFELNRSSVAFGGGPPQPPHSSRYCDTVALCNTEPGLGILKSSSRQAPQGERFSLEERVLYLEESAMQIKSIEQFFFSFLLFYLFIFLQ